MRFPRLVSFSLALLLNSAPLLSQQPSPTAQRDPQATTVINLALNAAGGIAALSQIQDYTGSGTIVYSWADSQVQGSVTVKGRGLAQFRLDATLPAGVRSFIVSNGTGSLRELDGTTTPIPYYQAVNFGSSVVFPLVHLLAALLNTSTNITYQGLVTRAGHQVHDIRVQGLSAPAATTAGVQANIPAQDFFIDSSTFQLISTLGKAYPKDGSLSAAPAEVQFSDYRQVNGILLPFAVTTLIAGQSASAIQLNQVTFNNNLTDSDFRP